MSKCFILMQTPLKLDIWLQSYEGFDNAKTIWNKRIWTMFFPLSQKQYRWHPTHSYLSFHNCNLIYIIITLSRSSTRLSLSPRKSVQSIRSPRYVSASPHQTPQPPTSSPNGHVLPPIKTPPASPRQSADVVVNGHNGTHPLQNGDNNVQSPTESLPETPGPHILVPPISIDGLISEGIEDISEGICSRKVWDTHRFHVSI